MSTTKKHEAKKHEPKKTVHHKKTEEVKDDSQLDGKDAMDAAALNEVIEEMAEDAAQNGDSPSDAVDETLNADGD